MASIQQLCSCGASIFLLLLSNSQFAHGWGWLMIGNWSSANFTLPCNRTCFQVPNENVDLQLTSYRCRGLEGWWPEQYTYNSTTKQITNQLPPARGSMINCLDIMANSTNQVGLAPCNASSKSQQWTFNGTKIRNGANNLFMQALPFAGNSLSPGAGLGVGVLDDNADFTLMDSTTLRSYIPRYEGNGPNYVRNGDFAENWNEQLDLVAGDMTEICNWTILQGMGLNNPQSDRFAWNVQLSEGNGLGAISQLVPTKLGQEHAVQFQGSGLNTCGGYVKNVSVSVVPSSKNYTIVSIPAGVGWQLQLVEFVPSGDFINLTIASAFDEGTGCGANITDIKLGLKGTLPVENSSWGHWLQNKKLKVALIILGVMLLAALVALISMCIRRWLEGYGLVGGGITRYTFWQIKKITSNFQNQIGSGGFSSVYLGVLADGTKVAVKRMLKLPDVNIKNEVDMLSRIHHRRIVRFLGFCDDKNEQILVFEYMKNGSLYDVLHRRSEGNTILSLEQRLKIARDVAQGLEYLHHGASPSVIHRDIKSANVLIDSNLSAKLTDFGTFKQGHENTFSIDAPMETDNYKGTYYYIDPTYAGDLTISTKSDVYSFGILLMELMTGQKAMVVHGLIFNATDTSTLNINMERELSNMVDPFMEVESASDAEALKMVISLAFRCLQPERESRPSMFEVVRVLGPGESCGESADDQVSTSLFTPVSAAGAIKSTEVSFSVDSRASTVQESFFSQGR